MSSIVLRVADVSVFRDDTVERRQILDRVSFECVESSITAIVGRSGVGKTTLLRAIAGLLDVGAGGSVEVDGVRVGRPGSDRALVFQEYFVYPWLSVRKNIEVGLRHVQCDERDVVVENLLDGLRLRDVQGVFGNRLSGGMQQRVALARALAVEPRVLLLDEPFGALDALTKQDAQKLLHDVLVRLRQAVLMVTHDLREAVRLGSSVVVIGGQPGKVIGVLSSYDAGSGDKEDMVQTIRELLERKG